MNLFNRNNRVRMIKRNTSTNENYFADRRWQLATLLEKYSGCWPYQSKLKQLSMQSVHFLVIISFFLAVINKMREYVGVDTEMSLECILTIIFFIVLMCKLLFPSTFQRSRKRTYEKIAEHFKIMTDAEEATILREFADQGYRYTITYSCLACIFVCIFNSVPLIEGFYYYFFVNGQLNVKLPLQLNYGFNHSKYWYIITLDFISCTCSGILVDFAYDLPFILQIRHVQALFEIVGMRLNKASELVNQSEHAGNSDEAADKAYSLITRAIDLHSECLELVKMVEKTYTSNWFIILSLNTGMFGAGIHLISLRIHDSIDTFRNVCAYFLVLMHFHVIFSQGQNIIDSSSTVADICYDCKWYGLPGKSCKLLTLMMIRTSVPCRITGAKFFPLSIYTFGKMLKAGVSYYTVFKA